MEREDRKRKRTIRGIEDLRKLQKELLGIVSRLATAS